MNLRTLMVALGAIGILAISPACEIKNGTGGSGGDGGDGGAGVGGMGGNGTGGAGGGTGGAGGMMAACYDKSCGEYITFNPEEPWCDDDPNFTPGSTNPSYDIYQALALCTCGDPQNPAVGGKCKTQCAMEACAGMDNVAGGECIKCIQDTSDMGCGKEVNACANDS